MALYPKATHRLLPQNYTQPRIDPISIVLHTAVSRSNDLYDFFNGRSNGVESHFYVTLEGKVLQYMDTTRRADCQRDGNRYAISIETEDNGASNPNDIIPWSAAQLAAIVELCVWACKTHGIPARKCPAYNASGLGYHSLFTGDPGWNTSHACPARARIAQFPTLLARVQAGVSGTTQPSEGDDLTPEQAQKLDFLYDNLSKIISLEDGSTHAAGWYLATTHSRQERQYDSLLKGIQTWGERNKDATELASTRNLESAKFTDDKVDEALRLLNQVLELLTPETPAQPLPLPKSVEGDA